MSKNEVLIHPELLENFITELFETTGMSHADAAFHAQALVNTNLWGVDSHGVLRVPLYFERLRKKAINPSPQIKTIRGSLGLEVLDGDAGAGFIVGREAMKRAIELAKEFNVGIVGAINSNHFGATAIYARLAVEQGMVGLAMTNVVPNIVAPGGSKPITGNNPLAIAVPTFGDFPFVLDISLSNVAGGKLLLASKKGEKIPLDWATDSQGHPTDDPDKAFAGFLLPVGAYKGLGLSYMVDILCGLITGGVFQHGMKGMYKYPNDPSLTGHFMIAINVSAIMSRDELKSRMAQFHQTIQASPMWDQTKEMLLPGELEYRTALTRQESGIPVPAKLYQELIELGQKIGVSSSLSE